MWNRAGKWCTTPFLFLCLTVAVHAQGRGQRGVQSAKAVAPIDLTGYWVSVVSEDWRHRMTTPRKGDYESLPLNAEGRRVADTWDLAKDNQAGVQCKAFGIGRSEEHTSELQSPCNLVCRLLLEKKKV